MGWIGDESALMYVLRSFKCDQKDGKFCVDGPITSFMGMGQEFVVGDAAVYYVNGQPKNLCQALEVTSYGQKVTVI